MKTISDKLIPSRGIHEVIIEDSHGRIKHINASLLSGDPEAFIQQEIAEFVTQEAKISEHISRVTERK